MLRKTQVYTPDRYRQLSTCSFVRRADEQLLLSRDEEDRLKDIISDSSVLCGRYSLAFFRGNVHREGPPFLGLELPSEMVAITGDLSHQSDSTVAR